MPARTSIGSCAADGSPTPASTSSPTSSRYLRALEHRVQKARTDPLATGGTSRGSRARA